jgi:hypothetical protein
MAFAVIAGIDLLMLIFLLIMIACGKFGDPVKGLEEDEEIRGPDTGLGGYADIPKLEINENG